MVILAIVLGAITGGFPVYSNEIATVALLIAMIVSMTSVSLKNVDIREEKKGFFYAFLINFGFLSFLTLLLGFFFFGQKELWEGFVVMAAVPPAIAIVPLTKILRGDTTFSLFSILLLYISSLFLTPLFIFIFLSKEIDIFGLLQTTFLLILLPLLISRFIKIKFDTSLISNFCFFIVVFAMIGSNREFLFKEWEILLPLSVALFIRTFGSGSIVKFIGKKLKVRESRIISYSLFASFKNDGLAMILASSLFSARAAFPALLAIVFEMMWMCCLEAKIV